MIFVLCDWPRMQRVFRLRFPHGKLDTLVRAGISWLETHHVFKSVTGWTVLLSRHKHVTLHNSSKKTTYSRPSLCAYKYCFQCFSVSVPLGFLHHWKMLWVKWWPGWMGKSNFQLWLLIKHQRDENACRSTLASLPPSSLCLFQRAPGWPARFGVVWYNIRKTDYWTITNTKWISFQYSSLVTKNTRLG